MNQHPSAQVQSRPIAASEGTSKLLQMIAEPTREQAEEEIGRLTPDELKLFLKLCRDRTVAHKLAVASIAATDAMTSSTVTSSETSSQDNSYTPAPQAITASST